MDVESRTVDPNHPDIPECSFCGDNFALHGGGIQSKVTHAAICRTCLREGHFHAENYATACSVGPEKAKLH